MPKLQQLFNDKEMLNELTAEYAEQLNQLILKDTYKGENASIYAKKVQKVHNMLLAELHDKYGEKQTTKTSSAKAI